MRTTLLVAMMMVAVTLAGCTTTDSTPYVPGQGTSGGLLENATQPNENRPVHSFAPPVPEGVFDKTGPWSRPLVAGEHQIMPMYVETLSSDVDGEPIQMAIYRPEGVDDAPVIMIPGPYYHDFNLDDGSDGCKANRPLSESPGPCGMWIEGIVESFVPHGYAVVLVAVRGTGGSGGCIEWFGPAEISDASQAVSWAASESWSNGRVGIYGLSWTAVVGFGVAATGHPDLATVVGFSGMMSIREWAILNGSASMVIHAGTEVKRELFYSIGFHQERAPGEQSDALCTSSTEARAAMLATVSDPYADPDGWFSDRDFRQGILDNYEGSLFIGSGLKEYPMDSGWVTMAEVGSKLAKQGNRVHWMQGDWGHTLPENFFELSLVSQATLPPNNENDARRFDWNELLLRWFDHELRDGSSRSEVERPKLWAPVQIQDNLGAWRSETAFPPIDAMPTSFPLDELDRSSAGLFGETYPSPFGGHTTFGTSGVEYTLSTSSDLRWSGAGLLRLNVQTEIPAGAAGVELVHAETGRTVMMGMLDFAYRDGGTTPKSVPAGTPFEVQIYLRHADVIIPAGENLLVRVKMAAEFREPDFQGIHPIQVLDGGELILPLIERNDPSVFFEAP